MAFRHTPLTREQMERRSEQKGQIIDPAINPKFKAFRPKVGKNYIRIMPPTWPNFEGWAYTVFLHRNVGADNGAYLCLRKMMREPCPVCEEVKALDNDGDTEAGKQLYGRKTSVAWIIDRNNQEDGPLVWMFGYTIEEDISGRCFHSKTGHEIDIIHPDEGFDVSFRRGNEKPFPKTGGVEIDRDPSPIDDDPRWQEHWLNFVVKNPIPDILQYYEYEHIYRVLHGKGAARPAPREDGEDARSTRLEPPPDREDEPETRTSRRAPPTDETTDEAPPRRRAAPPPDDDPPPRSRAAPPDEQEEAPPRRRTAPPAEEEEAAPPRRRAAPPAEDDPPPRGNGHDTVGQAREQIGNLRREAETGADDPPPRRRAAPPDDGDAAPPPRRRAAPADEEETPPPRRRAAPPDDGDPPPRRRPSRE